MVYFYNGQRVDYTDNNLIDKGTCGKIYLLDNNRCLKLYDEECAKKMEKDIFSLLKIYKLDNYYVLYDLVYDENKSNIGYISKYYRPSETNLLLMPMEYIVYNYNRIYESLMILTNNGVLAKDLYYKNVIIGDDKMTVIDADSYVYEKCDYEVLKSRNLSYLSYLFKGLYQDEAAKLGINLELDKTAYNKVMETFYTGDLTPDVLSKKLSTYNKGIDLIKR